jgi:hypothetical protein
VRSGAWRWIKASIAIGLAVQALMIAGDAFAYRISIPGFGHNSDLYHRTLGWRELGIKTAALARAAQAKTVTSEPRAEVASLIYDLRNTPLTVLSWSQSKEPADHFDLTRALTDKAAQPVLYIGACAKPGRLEQFYGEVTPLGEFTTTAGPHTTRRYYAFKLAQPKRPIAPLGPCK